MEALFTYVTPESFVPKDHSLRAIRKMADTAFEGVDKEQVVRKKKEPQLHKDFKKRLEMVAAPNWAFFQRFASMGYCLRCDLPAGPHDF